VLQYFRVSGVPCLIITGSGLDDWIYRRLLLQSLLIIINYNNSNRWLPKTRSIPSWTTSVYRRDWLGSDLQIIHFFSFRYPPVNTQQLNTHLNSTQLLNCLLHSLPAKSIPNQLRVLPLKLRDEPNRDHLEQLLYYSVFISCCGNVC
jgi:hypothetical protein